MAAFQFPDPAVQTTVVNPLTGSTYQWKEPPGKWVVTVKMRDVGDIIWEGTIRLTLSVITSCGIALTHLSFTSITAMLMEYVLGYLHQYLFKYLKTLMRLLLKLK